MKTLFLSLLCLFVHVHAMHDDIALEYGGYTNILVNIKDDISYNRDILPTLQAYFVDASKVLYTATRHNYNAPGEENQRSGMRYFKNITVFVPMAWAPYVEGICSKAGPVNRYRADFVVGPDTLQWQHLPHTEKNHGQCGVPQSNPVYLPETFITDPEKARETFGENLGKPIIHEWAIYRYGLHEESNAKDGMQNCETFEIDGKLVDREIRCSKGINGFIKRSTPNAPCEFRHNSRLSSKAKASLMFWGPEFLPEAETFCDDPSIYPSDYPAKGVTHDFEVDHNHNRNCDHMTGWEILRNHPDFADHEGPKYNVEFDARYALKYNCVYGEIPRIVLAMDASNSMQGERLKRMRQDVARFLDNLWNAREAVEIGMVEFNEFSYTLLPMTTMSSDEDLQRIKDAITNDLEWGTCIGCGLLEALKVLGMDGGTTVGGKLYVFTDGKETESTPPTIAAVHEEVVASKVTVYALLLLDQTDNHPLIELAKATGGSSCIYSETDGGTDYYQCLNRIHGLYSDQLPFEIRSKDHLLNSGTNLNDQVAIDSSFTDRVRFTMTYQSVNNAADDTEADEAVQMSTTNHCGVTDLQITTPTGEVIAEGDPGYTKDWDFKYISIESLDNQPGVWTYKIKNPSTIKCRCRIMVEGMKPPVTSMKDLDHPLAMSVRSSTNKINIDKGADPVSNAIEFYATLKKGNLPVLNAVVNARIESNAGHTWDIPLLDNGAGADLAKDDGIYSRYFYQYSVNGVYSVKIEARGVNGQTELLFEEREIAKLGEDISVFKSSFRYPYDDFERSNIGGFFDVANVPNDIDAIFPPAKITDLHIVGKVTEQVITLAWTSVGDSLDGGRANAYDLRIARSIEEIRDEFSNCLRLQDSHLHNGTLYSPKQTGRPESVYIDPHTLGHALNASFFFGIKAIDSKGNRGKLSKVAPAYFELETSQQKTMKQPLGIGVVVAINIAVICVVSVALVYVLTVVGRRTDANKVGPDDNNSKNTNQGKKKNTKTAVKIENEGKHKNGKKITTGKGDSSKKSSKKAPPVDSKGKKKNTKKVDTIV